jgi:hypothetical protein
MQWLRVLGQMAIYFLEAARLKLGALVGEVAREDSAERLAGLGARFVLLAGRILPEHHFGVELLRTLARGVDGRWRCRSERHAPLLRAELVLIDRIA